MSYSSAEGRTQILDDTAAAVELLGLAMAAVGDAYDQLDEQTAERMEEQVFRPLQAAYGQLRRTHVEFAQRVALIATPAGVPAQAAPMSAGAALERASEAIVTADQRIAELQDSLLPVEVGDQELRAALAGVRTALASLPAACRSLIRTLGR